MGEGRSMIHIFRRVLAFALIGAGTALLFLPGPGIPLLAVGATLLIPDLVRWGQRVARRLTAA